MVTLPIRKDLIIKNILSNFYGHTEFLQKLEKARGIANFPFIISSGYRSQNFNEKLRQDGYSASKNSSHLIGRAVDIRVKD